MMPESNYVWIGAGLNCCFYRFCGFFSLIGYILCCFNVFDNLCGGDCYFIFVCNYVIKFNRLSPRLSTGRGGRHDKLHSYWVGCWNLFFFRSCFKLIDHRWPLYPPGVFGGGNRKSLRFGPSLVFNEVSKYGGARANFVYSLLLFIYLS